MGYVDDAFHGLLEGHESGTHKFLYQMWMAGLVLFTILAGILGIAGDHGMTSVLTAVVAIGIMLVMFVLIRWYRTDGMASSIPIPIPPHTT